MIMIWQSTWKREIMKQFPDVVRRSFQVNPCKCFNNQYTYNMYDLTWLFYILRMDQPRLIKRLWNSWTLETLLINTMPSTCSWNQKTNCFFRFFFFHWKNHLFNQCPNNFNNPLFSMVDQLTQLLPLFQDDKEDI